MFKIDILADQTFWFTDTIKVQRLEVAVPNQPDLAVVGIDPGTTHLGVAYLHPQQSLIYEVHLVRNKSAYQRMIDARNVIGTLEAGDEWILDGDTMAVIEGASFADRYRQAELAEVRASIALWLGRKMSVVSFVPPTTIVKKVFGSGKARAGVVWDNLPPDAAAALACALYWNE